MDKSGPFFQNQGIFFDFQKKVGEASPLPNERLLLQNNGVVPLITKQHMQL